MKRFCVNEVLLDLMHANAFWFFPCWFGSILICCFPSFFLFFSSFPSSPDVSSRFLLLHHLSFSPCFLIFPHSFLLLFVSLSLLSFGLISSQIMACLCSYPSFHLVSSPPFLSSPPLSSPSLPEAMPGGGSATLRGSVRGAGGSFSMHSLLQSYSSSLHRPRSLGRSLSSYLNHTTRLGTHTHIHIHSRTHIHSQPAAHFMHTHSDTPACIYIDIYRYICIPIQCRCIHWLH